MARYFEIDDGPQVIQNLYAGIYSRLTPEGWNVMEDIQRVHERAEEISLSEAKKRAAEICPEAAEEM